MIDRQVRATHGSPLRPQQRLSVGAQYIAPLLAVILIACQTRPIPLSSSITPEPISEQAAQPNTLSGSLLTVQQDTAGTRITTFDLANLTERDIFTAPANGWINQIALSPNEEVLAVAYSPPGEDGLLRLDRSGIYLLPLNGVDPTLQPLLVPEQPNRFLYTPVWSADGQSLFYVRSEVAIGSSADNLKVDLMRYDLATQETVLIANDGIWAQVSADDQLTFIYVDPDTLERGLVITDFDGGQRRDLVGTGAYFDLDTPLFAADGSAVYVTIARENPVQMGWVRIAHAHANHNVPSAWWRVGLDGKMMQISAETDIILHGDVSGDGYLYFSTVTGLYVLDVATGAVQQLNAAVSYRTIAHCTC